MKLYLFAFLRTTFWRLVITCVLSAGLTNIIGAQPQRLSTGERSSILNTIRKSVLESYVIAEKRPIIIATLADAERAGRYTVEDTREFAERVTADLRLATADKHLWLSFDPVASAAMTDNGKSEGGEDSFRRRRATRNNHGLEEMKILPGNIRYLRISRFEWVSDETGFIYDAAMRFLSGGDAWIVDLRGNGGGNSSAANYFLSYFHSPGTLIYRSEAGSEPVQKIYALDHLPSGRLSGKPLYVLIDGNVGSAAEAVSYDLQQFGIAKIVGATSAGAAYNNKLIPITPGFVLSVSYGRPLHTLTNSNWEGVGVKPDVTTIPTKSLEYAHLLALKSLSANAGISAELRNEYLWSTTAAQARVRPVTLEPNVVRPLAGTFTSKDFGEIAIKVERDAIWMERSARPPVRIYPLTEDGIFAIDGTELMRVRLTQKAVELIWWNEPQPRVFARKQ